MNDNYVEPNLLAKILKFPLTGNGKDQPVSAAACEPVGGHAVKALDKTAQSSHAVGPEIEVKIRLEWVWKGYV